MKIDIKNFKWIREPKEYKIKKFSRGKAVQKHNEKFRPKPPH